MEGADLGRLNPVGFERLIRALCFANMGPAGTVYSSGPDGGRDFTYDGSIRGYEGKRWKGYLVIQAKFKDVGSSKTDDLKWLKKQLDGELRKYTQRGSHHRKPQYYILVTNLRLSGSDGPSNKKSGRQRAGGYTKVLELFAPWKAKLKLKDFDIWPHDKIIDLLAAHPSIRQSYAHWISPGDVLSKALQHLSSARPDFAEVTNRSLKNSLQRDQYVRLKDAGSVGDLQIRTSQVIVDLPLLSRQRVDSHRPQFQHIDESDELEDDSDDEPVPFKAIARLVDRAREKLDAETLIADQDRLEATEPLQARNRIVLMGGPGQGKSTISLFLAQLFRAAILRNQPGLKRDHAARALVPEILKRAADEGISTSFPARFPSHVSLPRYADAISLSRQKDARPPSLLSFIASEMSGTGDHDVDRSDLRNWLSSYPWLLVLDGLDEVPPTGERPAILEAINSFFTEVSEVNADILVVVTTRPQGYNKDLDEKLWEHWRLADLKPEQALSYAKAFGEARYPDDQARRQDVLRSLVKSAAQPATARLMSSPLQVTILHFIVDTGGGVPTARWTLFNEYFEVLKKREKAKGGELQRYLEKHWGHIGPIHHRAGLVLQADSEHAGGAGSRFTQERFRELITEYLRSEGFGHQELMQRVDELMLLATNRLVLLSQQIEGDISFDVRSLQEFMAAAAITSGDQNIMDLRLSHIAGHSHWRHVFQIAASRCFSDDSFHYRRATITQIARQMDAEKPDMLVKNGSRLALDLLADGIALDQPNFRRPLFQHALEQLELGPIVLDARLADVCDAVVSDLAEEAISQRILEGFSSSALSAWKLLFEISKRGHSWADDMIVRLWQRDKGVNADILDLIPLPLGSQRVADHIADSLAEAGPTLGVRNFSFAHNIARVRREERIDYSRLRRMNFANFLVLNDSPALKQCAVLDKAFPKRLRARYISLDSAELYAPFEGRDFDPPSWSAIRSVRRFSNSPSRSLLADTIRAFSAMDYRVVQKLSKLMPWPVATLIAESCGSTHLEQLAKDVEDGERGDVTQWRAAEKRWQSAGITESDLLSCDKQKWFGADIAERGFPAWLNVHGGDRQEAVSVVEKLVETSNTVRNQSVARLLVDAAALLAGFGRGPWPAHRVGFLIDILLKSKLSLPLLDFVISMPVAAWDEQPNVSKLAKLYSSSERYDIQNTVIRSIFMNAFQKFPNLEELFYPLLLSLLSDEFEARENAPAILSKLSQVAVLNDPLAKQAVTVANLAVCSPEMFDRALSIIIEVDATSMLLRALVASDLLPVERRLLILTLLIEKIRERNLGNWRDFVPAARRALDSRKSGLVKSEIWNHKLLFPPETYAILLPPLE